MTSEQRRRFTLWDAAHITEFSVLDLRNHIKRGLLKYLGESTQGKEREFGIVGMYEIGVIDALARGGLTLVDGAAVVHGSLDFIAGVIAWSMAIEQPRPDVADVGFENAYKQTEQAFADAREQVKSQPETLLKFEWANRNLNDPTLWIFDNHREMPPGVAHGWGEVEEVAKAVIKRTYPRLLQMVAPGAPAPSMPPVPEEYVLTARPHLHLFNVTAALVSIDRAIEEKLVATE